MDVRFALPELERIDALRCEALALPFFADDRPLRGALALVDWRMCGFVSKLIVRGALDGADGETALLPARPKLPMDKLFLFGLGESQELTPQRVRGSIDHMLDTLTAAGVRTSALCLPGRASDRLPAPDAMEAFVASLAARSEHDEIILLESADAQRAMERVMEHARRRARAALEVEDGRF